MARTHQGISGDTYYVKTAAQIALAWPGTVISGTEIGTTGVFEFAGLTSTLDYYVFRRETAVPLATDLNVGVLEVESPTAIAISTQIADDATDGTNHWDDGKPALALATVAAMKSDGDFGTTGLLADADAAKTQATTAATQATATRKVVEADVVLELDGSVYVQKTLERGTTTELIPDKIIKQPSGSDLTNPATQRFGGAAQEPV